jgi:hypothetical protein
MHAKKCVMKKKKKRTSFPFHIRNASFWLSVPDARDKGTSHTELWVLLSFRQGYHVQELPVGILQSRKCCKNKNKGIAVVTCQAS